MPLRVCNTPGCTLPRNHLGNHQGEIGACPSKRRATSTPAPTPSPSPSPSPVADPSYSPRSEGDSVEESTPPTQAQKRPREAAWPLNEPTLLCEHDGDTFDGLAKKMHRSGFAIATAERFIRFVRLGGDPVQFRVLYLETRAAKATQELVWHGLPPRTLYPCNREPGELDVILEAYPDAYPVVADVYNAYNELHPQAVWFDTMETWLNLEEEEQSWNFNRVPPFWKSEVVAISLSCRRVKGGANFFANELQHLIESKGGMLHEGVREYRGRSATNMIFGMANFPDAFRAPADHFFLKLVHVPLSKFPAWKGHKKYKKVVLEDGAPAIVGRVTSWTDAEKTHGFINYLNADGNYFTNHDDAHPLSLAEIRKCHKSE